MGLDERAELNRGEILGQVVQRRATVRSADEVMDLGPPQVHRFLKAFEAKGPGAIRHKARGRVSNHRTGPAVREYALMLLRERYPDFGPTLAAEKLAENLGLKVSRKTLRKWMIAGGIWLSRKQRRRFNQPRLRQEWLIQPSQRHYFAKGCEGFTSWSVTGSSNPCRKLLRPATA